MSFRAEELIVNMHIRFVLKTRGGVSIYSRVFLTMNKDQKISVRQFSMEGLLIYRSFGFTVINNTECSLPG